MSEACSVLLVEDDDVDALNVQRAFKKNKIEHPLLRACDGVEALEILRSDNWSSDHPQPNIVILDINMPRMNGLEFLQHVRDDQALQHLSVFILSTSNNQNDLNEAYRLKAAGYFLKPFDFERFVTAVKVLNDFWCISERPSLEASEHSAQILLVDDDQVVRMVISSVLQNSGYNVIDADNGVQALEQLKTNTPDLIITDLSMPEMDGWELIENIQKSEKLRKIPIILMSADNSDACKAKASAHGIELLLPKSMGAAVIRVQAKKILNKK